MDKEQNLLHECCFQPHYIKLPMNWRQIYCFVLFRVIPLQLQELQEEIIIDLLRLYPALPVIALFINMQQITLIIYIFKLHLPYKTSIGEFVIEISFSYFITFLQMKIQEVHLLIFKMFLVLKVFHHQALQYRGPTMVGCMRNKVYYNPVYLYA